jgi:hypothetical protein
MADQVHLIALTDEELAIINEMFNTVADGLGSCEHQALLHIQAKFDLKPTHYHVERKHEVRLVALQVKKHGCEVPLTVFETACGKFYARTRDDFANRYAPK